MASSRQIAIVTAQSQLSGPAVIRTNTGTFTPFGGAGTIPGPALSPKKRSGGGGVLGTIGGAIGERLGGRTGREIGQALGGAIGGSGSKPGQPSSGQGGFTGGVGPCPAGTFRGPASTCIDLIPGGATSGHGILVPNVGGGSIQMSLGAIAPGVRNVQTFDCPPSYVLGIDNLCYHKKILPKQFRKWAPAAKPLISANDAKILRRADSLRGKVKRVAMRTGFTVKKK